VKRANRLAPATRRQSRHQAELYDLVSPRSDRGLRQLVEAPTQAITAGATPKVSRRREQTHAKVAGGVLMRAMRHPFRPPIDSNGRLHGRIIKMPEL